MDHGLALELAERPLRCILYRRFAIPSSFYEPNSSAIYLLTHSLTIALAVNPLFTRRLSTNTPFTGPCLDATQSSAAGY